MPAIYLKLPAGCDHATVDVLGEQVLETFVRTREHRSMIEISYICDEERARLCFMLHGEATPLDFRHLRTVVRLHNNTTFFKAAKQLAVRRGETISVIPDVIEIPNPSGEEEW